MNRQPVQSDPEKGCVLWITGLAGSGKSTVGRKLATRLRADDRIVVYLDGDIMREVLGEKLGHGVSERKVLAGRYSRLCRMLSDQGLWVVCATVSMFHDCRRWNRTNIRNYLEIYLRVPLKTLAARDPKRLYSRTMRGEIEDVVGVDIAAEEPETPDLVIDNHGAMTPDRAVEDILRRLPIDGHD